MSGLLRHDRKNFLCLICLLTVSISGCGYGKISPLAYQYATTLYSICNQKDEKRLDLFATKLKAATAGEELNSRESDWLTEIVELARAGDWQRANEQSRRLMTDQVQGGP